MIKNQVNFSYTKYDIIDDKGVITEGPAIWKNYDFKKYFVRRGIANSSVILSTRVIKNQLLNDSYSGYAEDTAFWMSIMEDGHIAYLVPETLINYRKLKTGRSRQKLKNASAVLFIYRYFFKISALQLSYIYPLYVSDVILRSRFKKTLKYMFPNALK